MARIVRDAVAAGAMGFSTSRTFFHRSSDGSSTPSFAAAEEELMALALALKDCGRGAMQLITDFDEPDAVFAMLRRLVERSGRPLSVSLLEGAYGPMTLRWRDILDGAAAATAAGLPIKAQVLGRAIGVMLGHELTLNTFYTCESYRKLAHLPFDERIRELRRPGDAGAGFSPNRPIPIRSSCWAASRASSTTCSCSAIRRTTSSRWSRASRPRASGSACRRKRWPTT